MFAIFSERRLGAGASFVFVRDIAMKNTGEMEIFSKEANDFVSLVRILLTSYPYRYKI